MTDLVERLRRGIEDEPNNYSGMNTKGAYEIMCEAADRIEELEWQPIETAPKDGTRVLLFVPPYGPSTGHYKDRSNWGPSASNWYAHAALNKEAEPTHWMPLPEPPKDGPRSTQKGRC